MSLQYSWKGCNMVLYQIRKCIIHVSLLYWHVKSLHICGGFFFMPKDRSGDMLLKSCKRCGKMIPYPKVYCESCQPIIDKMRELRQEKAKRKANSNYNKKRDPKYLRFYNSPEWRVTSRAYIQGQGYRCEGCGKIATEVHHKQFIQTEDGWNRRLDYDNLEALCVDCHNKAHNRFRKKRKALF